MQETPEEAPKQRGHRLARQRELDRECRAEETPEQRGSKGWQGEDNWTENVELRKAISNFFFVLSVLL